MNESEVIDYIMKTFPEVETLNNYGYDMFFCKSDRKLSSKKNCPPKMAGSVFAGKTTKDEAYFLNPPEIICAYWGYLFDGVSI